MNWQELIISIASIVLTALSSWAVKTLVDWLNTKIKDTKIKSILNEAIGTVTTVVQATYQTYVQSLKDTNAFTEEAQKTALNNAVETAKAQLSSEVLEWLDKNKISPEEWLKTQIESIIYELKNQNK